MPTKAVADFMQKVSLILSILPDEKLRAVLKKEKLLEIGNNIRKWRTLKGIKQGFLADELEISKVSISKIERGKTDIPVNRLFQIASVLNIKLSFFLQTHIVFYKKSEKFQFR